MNRMNESDELDEQLRSWVPRRPSASLKRRLFARVPASPALAHAWPAADGAGIVRTEELPSFRLNWLAPGFAALLLTFVVFAQRSLPAAPGSTSGNALIAAALSNQSTAAWLPASLACGQNRVPAETLEWTNGTGGSGGTAVFSPQGVH